MSAQRRRSARSQARSTTDRALTGRAVVALLCGALLLPACSAQPPAGDGSVRVYKSLGGVQCGERGATLADLDRELTEAGARPTASTCGTDGRMRPAVCGASDGRIAIFDVPAAAASAAEAAGFVPLARARDAREAPCR